MISWKTKLQKDNHFYLWICPFAPQLNDSRRAHDNTCNIYFHNRCEPPRDKTNKLACARSEDSDQPGHPPSLIRDFAVRIKKAWVLIYPLSAQRRLWSDWANAQADLSLRWAHMSVCWVCHEAAHVSTAYYCHIPIAQVFYVTLCKCTCTWRTWELTSS